MFSEPAEAKLDSCRENTVFSEPAEAQLDWCSAATVLSDPADAQLDWCSAVAVTRADDPQATSCRPATEFRLPAEDHEA